MRTNERSALPLGLGLLLFSLALLLGCGAIRDLVGTDADHGSVGGDGAVVDVDVDIHPPSCGCCSHQGTCASSGGGSTGGGGVPGLSVALTSCAPSGGCSAWAASWADATAREVCYSAPASVDSSGAVVAAFPQVCESLSSGTVVDAERGVSWAREWLVIVGGETWPTRLRTTS